MYSCIDIGCFPYVWLCMNTRRYGVTHYYHCGWLGAKITQVFLTTYFPCCTRCLKALTHVLTHVSSWKTVPTLGWYAAKQTLKSSSRVASSVLTKTPRERGPCLERLRSNRGGNQPTPRRLNLKPTRQHKKWIQMFVSQRVNTVSFPRNHSVLNKDTWVSTVIGPIKTTD